MLFEYNNRTWVNQTELADLIGIRAITLKYHRDRGRLPFHNIEYQIIYCIDEIENFIREQYGINLQEKVKILLRKYKKALIVKGK